MVTDYDCWHPDHDHVTVDAVVKVLARQRLEGAQPGEIGGAKLHGRTQSCTAGCHTALDAAIITPPEARDRAVVRRLDAVAGRVLNRA